jgi:hypothetical protein
MEGFCFVISITGFNKLKVGKDDDDDNNNNKKICNSLNFNSIEPSHLQIQFHFFSFRQTFAERIQFEKFI